MQLYPAIVNYLQTAAEKINAIPAERKEILNSIAAFVKERLKAGQEPQLVFICTHNSRRSHIAQLWAAAAAAYYEIHTVQTYSGGTEITAFNPNAVKALTDAGLHITVIKQGRNPLYEVKLGDDLPALVAYSKHFMDAPNPAGSFAAIMTCSSADKDCPFVPGAIARIATPFDDPKAADGTPQQEQVYAERCKDIAIEMLYVFSQVKMDEEAFEYRSTESARN